MDKLKRAALAVTASALILGSLATPAFASGGGAEVVVDPGQSVTGSLTKGFNGVPVAEVKFTGGRLTAEVTGTICDGTLVWSLSVDVGGDGKTIDTGPTR